MFCSALSTYGSPSHGVWHALSIDGVSVWKLQAIVCPPNPQLAATYLECFFFSFLTEFTAGQTTVTLT